MKVFHFWSPDIWSRKSLIWEILSNSRDTLKLLTPIHSWKTMSGWTNYSGTVTSQKISEKKMSYRGSKSVILKNIIVKEQREYDSKKEKYILLLRCSLTGFERNYQVKPFSNQLPRRENSKFYSSLAISQSQIKLNPYFITGFSDASQKLFSSFFEKYPLSGSKASDFAKWRKIALLIKNKAHLTPEGLSLICNIKANMKEEEIQIK